MLLLDLMYSKHHVFGLWSGQALYTGCRQIVLKDAGDELVEEDVGLDFSGNGKPGNAPVISAVLFRA